MRANLYLGSISGIKIKVHWTFFFLIAWVILTELQRGGNLESILFNVAFVLTVFLCVVLHELGHSLTAKYFGVSTKSITLLPIGGVSSLNKIPESPKEEILVTIAGPLVNVIIAVILYFVIPVKELMKQNLGESLGTFSGFTLSNFLFYLFIVNIALVIFNMIPAFPMDGGRILRAFIASKTDRVKATQIAAKVGQIFAVLFLLLGLLYNPLLVIIALFIFIGAYSENQLVQQLALIKGHTVEEAMLFKITTFRPDDPLDIVVNRLISSTENNFVVTENGKILGLLYHKDIIDNSNKDVLVKDVMCTNFRIISSEDDLRATYRLIHNSKKSFFPVVDNNKLVGAIDDINLNEYILLQSKLAY